MQETLSPHNEPQSRQGTDSFDAFCRQYLPVLERYLVCQAMDSRWASDITRDTIIAARGRWSVLLTTARPDCWLFEAATRDLRRLEARARSRCQARDHGVGVDDLRIEAGADPWVCDHLGVVRAVRSLPRRQAEVVGLHYLVGYSIEDTARILGICTQTASAQLDRALAVVVVREDQLRVAAAAIAAIPAADLDRRLRRLDQRRRSLTGLTELRQQAEFDSSELEQAAYLLAGKYRDEGDLAAAARWYRMAASRDFSDASLELAKVLERLSHSEAAQWYGRAYAAGHLESPDRREAFKVGEPKVDTCPRGGLGQVMHWQLTAATVHVGTCRPCQNELLSYGGIVPAVRVGRRERCRVRLAVTRRDALAATR